MYTGLPVPWQREILNHSSDRWCILNLSVSLAQRDYCTQSSSLAQETHPRQLNSTPSLTWLVYTERIHSFLCSYRYRMCYVAVNIHIRSAWGSESLVIELLIIRRSFCSSICSLANKQFLYSSGDIHNHSATRLVWFELVDSWLHS